MVHGHGSVLLSGDRSGPRTSLLGPNRPTPAVRQEGPSGGTLRMHAGTRMTSVTPARVPRSVALAQSGPCAPFDPRSLRTTSLSRRLSPSSLRWEASTDVQRRPGFDGPISAHKRRDASRCGGLTVWPSGSSGCIRRSYGGPTGGRWREPSAGRLGRTNPRTFTRTQTLQRTRDVGTKGVPVHGWGQVALWGSHARQ